MAKNKATAQGLSLPKSNRTEADAMTVDVNRLDESGDTPNSDTTIAQTVVELLDSLFQQREQRRALEAELQAKLAALIPPEVMKQIEAWQVEAVARLEALDKANRIVEEQVEKAVLALGKTVKGQKLMGVWSRPSVVWDDDWLLSYSAARPEVLVARHEGKPRVTIRAARGG